jgi:plasmid maintenance system antidote protein VapI
MANRALESLKELGFMDPADSIPWREAFPEYREEDLPGVSLLGARTKEGMTQTRLSELIGIPQRHLSMMEHGKRPIGKKNARLLAKVLKVDYRVFL